MILVDENLILSWFLFYFSPIFLNLALNKLEAIGY